jgi:hypothetical protein
LAKKEYPVAAGTTDVEVDFDLTLDEPQYGFVVLKKNPFLTTPRSETRITGVVAVFNRYTQQGNEERGIDTVPFFLPTRRPQGTNYAVKFNPPLKSFGAEQLRSGIFRPALGASNAWVAPLKQNTATLKAEWKAPQTINRVVLWFDTDFDFSMESLQFHHPESVIPFCVQNFKLLDEQGKVVYETTDNHHSRCEIRFESPIKTSSLTLELNATDENIPISLFGIQAFE